MKPLLSDGLVCNEYRPPAEPTFDEGEWWRDDELLIGELEAEPEHLQDVLLKTYRIRKAKTREVEKKVSGVKP